jgi:hypothetical protein
VFLSAPRELRRMLAAAEEAIAAGRYAEAVEALGSILVDTDSEDYFLGTGEGTSFPTGDAIGAGENDPRPLA